MGFENCASLFYIYILEKHKFIFLYINIFQTLYWQIVKIITHNIFYGAQ